MPRESTGNGAAPRNSILPSPVEREAEPSDIVLLQNISSELIHARKTEVLYERIVDAAARIMRSDHASMQMLYPERGTGGELRLLAFRGFNPEAARFWEWVRADSKSTCGLALLTGKRAVAPDIARCEFMEGSEDQRIYLQTGIQACQTTPLVARNGKIVGMISTHWRTPHVPCERDLGLFDILVRQAADLIERTQREQELSERAALLDLSTDAIIMHDARGRILYWNRGAEQMYGWMRDEALGKSIHLLLQSSCAEPPEAIEAELLRKNRWQGEAVHTRRDGRHAIVLCRKVLDAGSGSGSAVVLETNTDITERKRAQQRALEQKEQLRKAEKIAAAGQLAASLAHEINNPLTAVVNLLYLLQHGPDLDTEARNLVTAAESELARVSRIVKQSLSYYRCGTVPAELDLAAIAEESLGIFSDRMRRVGVQLKKKIMPRALILGFPDEIRQVIDNLLINALEATPVGGQLVVSLRESRDWKDAGKKGVRITIADSGCGVRPENFARIFEPFFTTKNEKGTGLGLWVVRGIVEKHGATIRVRTKSTGHPTGTVVSVLWRWTGELGRIGRARSEPAA